MSLGRISQPLLGCREILRVSQSSQFCESPDLRCMIGNRLRSLRMCGLESGPCVFYRDPSFAHGLSDALILRRNRALQARGASIRVITGS
jgi:hypothetical protein